MTKEDIIDRLETLCGTSSTSGYARQNFRIHQQNRNSFEGREGNHLDWSDPRNITITFTKLRPTQAFNKASKKETILGKVGTFLFEAAGEIHKNQMERENAKRVVIPFRFVTGIGFK